MSDALSSIELQTPTATTKKAAALQVNLSGNPYQVESVLAGHPLPLQTEWVFTGSTTDFALGASPGAGTRHAVTLVQVLLSQSASVNVSVRIGFGTTTLPLESTAGTNGVFVNHELTPGGGLILGNGSAIVSIGPANTPIRITMTVPTGGKLKLLLTYYQPQIA